ncbi:MAG: hypothetical protein IPG35_03795 [Flavobacteriales bacterium]|nr:hypothetical protein [Flavobacteriales bacterium]
MDTPMTHEQSLRLIESMMSQAKRSFSRMSFYFLTWGILLTLAMLGTHVWSGVDPGIRYGAPWGVAGVVGGALSMWYGARQSRKEEVLNPMDRIINWLWASFVIALLLVLFTTLLEGGDPGIPITLMTGIPTFLTGQIMRFRPLVMGGVLFWVAGVVMQLVPDAGVRTIVYCAAMLLGYIVPGILLMRKENGVRPA